MTAYELDGVKVKGYIATSLMDSFEWLNGYKLGFGFHHVDFGDINRPRTPKYSAHYYYQIMKDNGFPLPDDERMEWGHFPKDFIWSCATAAYQVSLNLKFLTNKLQELLSFCHLFFSTFRLKEDGEKMEKV